ncbi:hypothetical protein [Chrysiogenes arsenatis]|uniref:hypothetical protein n=1 Tax=Chrysiogenes arsenatis TaxID=309797 RepID=UPI00041FBE3F|nr:hypothetical protein [Chrysiogenes arsenatis]
MENLGVVVMGNNYVKVIENKDEGSFLVYDLIKEKVILTAGDFAGAEKLYMEKSKEYVASGLDEMCTMRGISVKELLKGLEVLPKNCVVDFSVSYDPAANKLKVCQ